VAEDVATVFESCCGLGSAMGTAIRGCSLRRGRSSKVFAWSECVGKAP
jgi:hypothetical protein